MTFLDIGMGTLAHADQTTSPYQRNLGDQLLRFFGFSPRKFTMNRGLVLRIWPV